MASDKMPMERSSLFSLQPLTGAGVQTESLISYLVRLARAHQIQVRPLIREIISPMLDIKAESLSAPFFHYQARTVNGVGRYAWAFSQALQELTGITGLENLTLRPWRGVIPEIGTGLLAKEVKWCPACLAEQRLRRLESHFPLVWSMEHYQVCPQHRRHLHSRCPWCNKLQHIIPYYPDQARCTHCFGFLAPSHSLTFDNGPITTSASRWARSLESMITLPEQRIAPSHQQLIEILQTAADQWADGEKQRLSRMLKLGSKTICSWSSKQQKPAFPQLLQIADALDLTLHQLFSQSLPVFFPGPPSHPTQHIAGRQKTHIAIAEIEAKLKEYLEKTDIVFPVSQILKQLGLTRSYAKYWLPELLGQLATKHRERNQECVYQRRESEKETVKEVFNEMVDRGIYPSIRRMSQALKPYRLSLQRPQLREEYNRLRSSITSFKEVTNENR